MKNKQKRKFGFWKNKMSQIFQPVSARLGQALQLCSGQAMLMVVLILGSVMLGATTIAGFVTIQKIRTATDIMDSAMAIYAADAGLENCLYKKYSSTQLDPDFDCSSISVTLDNNASVSVQESGGVIKSIGTSNRASRAFGLFLNEGQ